MCGVGCLCICVCVCWSRNGKDEGGLALEGLRSHPKEFGLHLCSAFYVVIYFKMLKKFSVNYMMYLNIS